MKKCLVKIKVEGIFYYKDGEKIFGCLSGLWGNVSGLRGDVDDCKITDEERENGVDIKELIK